MTVDREEVMEVLSKVVDPEIGIPITEMKLIDDVKIEDGNVYVEFHLTMPWCPPVFAMKIASDIKEGISKVKGVKKVEVRLKDHYMADYINEKIEKLKF